MRNDNRDWLARSLALVTACFWVSCSDGTGNKSDAGSGGGTAQATGGGSQSAGGGSASTGGGAEGTGGGTGTGGGFVDGGFVGRACAQRLICDDFENNSLGTPPSGWQVDLSPSGATLAVDATRAYGGTKSVRMTATTQNDVFSQIWKSSLASKKLSAIYGRMRIWTNEIPRNLGHWNLIDGFGYGGNGSPSGNPILMYSYGGGWNSLTSYAYGPSQDCCLPCGIPGAPTLPLKRWVCLEWHFDTAAHTMGFWLDGQPVPELTVNSPAQAGNCKGSTLLGPTTFDRVRVGWYGARVQDAGVMETWIDDVSMDTERIGCGSSP